VKKKEPRRNYLVGFVGEDPQVYCLGVTYIELMTKKEAVEAIPALTNPGRRDYRAVFRLVPVRRASKRKPESSKRGRR
jgi:hypothetical protein